MEIFKRDQSSQSRSALDVAKENGWVYGNSSELLGYEDGKIFIPFSHEKLLLGSASQAFRDSKSLWAAKFAYIASMPSGNGGIYRSLVPDIESMMGDPILSGKDRFPSVLFTKDNDRQILQAAGLNTPLDPKALLNRNWVSKFTAFSASRSFSKFRDSVFQSLEKLCAVATLMNEKDTKDKIKIIKFVRPSDIFTFSSKMAINPWFLRPVIVQKLTSFSRGTVVDKFV